MPRVHYKYNLTSTSSGYVNILGASSFPAGARGKAACVLVLSTGSPGSETLRGLSAVRIYDASNSVSGTLRFDNLFFDESYSIRAQGFDIAGLDVFDSPVTYLRYGFTVSGTTGSVAHTLYNLYDASYAGYASVSGTGTACDGAMTFSKRGGATFGCGVFIGPSSLPTLRAGMVGDYAISSAPYRGRFARKIGIPNLTNTTGMYYSSSYERVGGFIAFDPVITGRDPGRI